MIPARLGGALMLVLTACDLGTALRGRVRVLTPHEQYAAALVRARLDSTALGMEWLGASDSALRAPIAMPLPAREAGFFSRGEARAVAYRLTVAAGERLEVTFDQVEGLGARVYVDLFEISPDTVAGFVHRATARDSGGRLVIVREMDQAATMLLRLQPELLREGRYELVMRVAPILAFPVAGHGNRAVQSRFGVDRDAGRRRHEGIDIFAPRGTPVVASTNGVVRSTRPNELGGTVIWLSDGERRQSLYYAHLDSLAVSEGVRVATGDTIGFVGNTGNARTTKPHLHFGIYRRGQGAIDPFPWVRQPTRQPSAVLADTARLGAVVALGAPTAVLRVSPGLRADTVRTLVRSTLVHVVGAQDEWYRVQLATGEVGYITPKALGSRLAVRLPRDAVVARGNAAPDDTRRVSTPTP